MQKNAQKLQKYRGGTHLNKDKPDVVSKIRRGKKVQRTIREMKIYPRLAGALANEPMVSEDAVEATV